MNAKPIYLVDSLGEYAVLPDGAIINAGGVTSATFTVGGRALLFADGTATDNIDLVSLTITLQDAYDHSPLGAQIDLIEGRDIILQSINEKQLRFDAETGDVTITGNLLVQGSTTTVTDDAVNTDRVIIQSTAGTYIPFTLEPGSGITPTVDLVRIRSVFGASPVFSIDPSGETHIQTLNVGLINEIDIEELQDLVQEHLEPTGIKHTSEQISTDGFPGDNVQEALEDIYSTIEAGVHGYEHLQALAADPWVITHGRGTKRVQISVWDEDDELILPASITATDINTITINFGTPVIGRAVLMLF